MQVLVMKFFVHKVAELYSNLQNYDLRASLRFFNIVPPATSVEYATLMEAVYYHG